MAAVLVSTLIAIISILDLASAQELRDAWGKTVLVVGVMTLAVLIVTTILKSGRAANENEPGSKG